MINTQTGYLTQRIRYLNLRIRYYNNSCRVTTNVTVECDTHMRINIYQQVLISHQNIILYPHTLFCFQRMCVIYGDIATIYTYTCD